MVIIDFNAGSLMSHKCYYKYKTFKFKIQF